jgi:DNA-directed RNA polymerase alpha subunit
MLSEIPTWAIEIISVYENSSCMLEQNIGHRLGLIPIRINDPSLSDADIKNTKIILNENYNKNKADLNGLYSIYTRDLMYDKTKLYIDPNILLLKLKEHQKVHLECTLDKNIGYEHCKWSPVAGIYIKEENVEIINGININNLNDSRSFILEFESIGQLDPKDILIKALDILTDKLSALL